MKKILLFILMLFAVIILLPTFLVLCMAKKPQDAPLTASGPAVTVYYSDTGETKSIPLESYLPGVVAAEMPASFHAEALKAQAVAARTYIYNRMFTGATDDIHPSAHVCTDSTHCKAWISDEKMHTDLGENWYETYFPKIEAAVRDTCGEIVTYNSEPIVAVFHSTGSGRTENSADVWGGDLPYLKSVESAGDMLSPKFSSTVEVPKTEVCEKLGVSDAHVYEYTRSEGGAVLTVNIGGFLFRGVDIRSHFDLNAANFEIEETDDDFIFHVKGNGHGVGLSQYGANAMAENGSTYTDILTTYYTGVSLSKAW